MTLLHTVVRVLHITAGTLTLTTGSLAMLLAKGSRYHRLSGNVFFASMIVVGLAGVTLSLMKATPNVGNILGGSMAIYMVSTAWITVIRPPSNVGRPEIALALLGVAGAIVASTLGAAAMNAPNGRFAGYPAPLYFGFAAVAALGAGGDFRVIRHGGSTGTSRTVRHLWRMCVAFYLATASFFFGQPKFVPTILKQTNLYIVAGLLPLILMFYWLVRVRVAPASVWQER